MCPKLTLVLVLVIDFVFYCDVLFFEKKLREGRKFLSFLTLLKSFRKTETVDT